jgi:hypothetical protein
MHITSQILPNVGPGWDNPGTMTLLIDTPPAAPAPADPAPAPGPERARRPLTIGNLTVDTPVMLAPMAGVTNMAFRVLCREFGALHSQDDGGLFPTEMVTTRALIEDHAESWRLLRMDSRERPRSVQLYGVDPAVVARSIEMILERDGADHIDLNFGCPVPKAACCPGRTSCSPASCAPRSTPPGTCR